MKLFLLAATVFWLAASIFGMAQTADPNAGATAGTEGHEDHEAAPLIFWNRKITIFRASYDQLNPAERAANAAARLEALPEQSTWKVDAIEVPYGRTPRALISVNNKLAFIIMPEDLDPESGDTLKDAADHAVTQLRATLEARARQRNMPLLLQAIGLSLVATLIALFAFSLVIRASTRSLSWLERFAEERARPVAIAGVNLRPMTMVLKRIAIKIIAWAAGITLGYLWLTFVLMRFPYSQPWGEQLGTFLTNLFGKLTSGALYSIPGIFTVLIIYLMARIVAQLTSSVFHEVEARGQPIAWIHPDTARATRRILVALIWIFALIIAYPYIPGSNTEAFKGVSVFVGLMISLGSAGLINQIMSGLVVIYSRALKAGEYVRVGDDEGLVSEVGMLSTKIATWKHEEITIPNAVLVSTKTVNYSRLTEGDGDVVSTAVTIGYDTPWRQVHAMLLLAAERTSGLRKDPRPRVVQRTLSDFYVEYQLVAHLYIPEERAWYLPEERAWALSELHAQIQDAFNEFGVQIMSPHFQYQPSDRVYVPKSQWFTEPADVSANSGQRKNVTG